MRGGIAKNSKIIVTAKSYGEGGCFRMVNIVQFDKKESNLRVSC